jgi:STE24 endopeptidase
MLSPSTYYIIIIAIIVFDFGLERTLSWLNDSWRGKTPAPEVQGLYDEQQYQKQQEYSRVNGRFALLSSGISVAGIMAVLWFDGFGWLDHWCRTITEHYILLPLLFFGILGILSDVLGVPFALYRTFVIEERFGFNKTTPKTFVFDKLKGYVVGAIVGGGVLAGILWIYSNTGPYFWVVAWGAIGAFTLLMTMFFAALFLPLFNKLSPLENGELRGKIEQYCSAVGFTLKNLFVMDGSKRSSKANAFFSGVGPSKKIVLYDTLVEQHTDEELVAVLAHEVGHYKKKHTMTTVILSNLQLGLMLFIFSIFISDPNLSQALGASQTSFHIGALGYALLYSPLSTLLGMGMALLSRKNEYEADAYAVATADGEALQNALKKMSVEQLSNLTPHPAYVFVHYSHPPLAARLKAMQGIQK